MSKRLKAGFAEVVITPPVGCRLAGYADRTTSSTGILDELYAKAMVLESGGAKLVLVVCDLLGLSRSITAAIRRRIGTDLGIDARNIMVTTTHTHCGPDLTRLDDTQIDYLISQVTGSVRYAAGDLTEAEIGFASGSCMTGVNRRNPDAHRSPYFLYSHPDGHMDTTVMVMSVRDLNGRVLGTLVNYACHPVVLGSEELNMSKDFIHFTCELLKNAFGEDTVPMYLQGCCGNVNPRWIYDDATKRPVPPARFPESLAERLAETRRLGYILGGEALKTAASITRYVSEVDLGAAVRTLTLPVRKDLPEHLWERVPPAERASHTKYSWLADEIAKSASTVFTEVQTCRIGEAMLVGLPGEVFVEYQQELRQKIDSPFVFVSELANDCVDYIPTPEAFIEGGYEPTDAYFAPEAGSLMIEKVLESMRA